MIIQSFELYFSCSANLNSSSSTLSSSYRILWVFPSSDSNSCSNRSLHFSSCISDKAFLRSINDNDMAKIR